MTPNPPYASSTPPWRRRLGLALLSGLTGLAVLAATPAQAHEFWMLPDNFTAPAGGSASLSLSVGENFAGDLIGISQPLVVAFRHYAGGGVTDLRGTVSPATPVAAVRVGLAKPGTHLFAMDTQPSHISLPADKFHAYLHDEGLDYVVKAREAAGTAATPGRERFRRNLKTLVQVGGQADATYAVRTGQRLELVPLANPYRHTLGKDLGFQVVFDGQPLADALVKTWHRRGGQTLIIRTITDAEGKVTVTPPWPGTWMVSVVHMVPVTDTPDHDWDSYWGNLTFGLSAPRAGR